jgi:hypothetical protein
MSGHELCPPGRRGGLRSELEHELAELLAEHDMEHLDIAQMRSRDCIVTQTVSRALFERHYAGAGFGSNLDDRPCYALVERRAEREPNGEPVELTPELPPLQQVCEDFCAVAGLAETGHTLRVRGRAGRGTAVPAASTTRYFGHSLFHVTPLIQRAKSSGW